MGVIHHNRYTVHHLFIMRCGIKTNRLIMKEKNFSPQLRFILRVMHWVILKRYDPTIFDSDTWYYTYEWTVRQENRFKTFLLWYMVVSRKARIVICGYRYYHSVNLLKRSVTFFTSLYGWRTKGVIEHK